MNGDINRCIHVVCVYFSQCNDAATVRCSDRYHGGCGPI